jgi:hypothetical protein
VKKFIYVIYVVFAILMGFTFYMAHSTFDGLVEPGYYKKSKEFFNAKEAEEALGLSVSVPETLADGPNRFRVEIGATSGTLEGAKVELYVGDVKTMKSDMSFTLRETSPGVYETEVTIPYGGKWLMRLEIDHESIKTERRWFIKV